MVLQPSSHSPGGVCFPPTHCDEDLHTTLCCCCGSLQHSSSLLAIPGKTGIILGYMSLDTSFALNDSLLSRKSWKTLLFYYGKRADSFRPFSLLIPEVLNILLWSFGWAEQEELLMPLPSPHSADIERVVSISASLFPCALHLRLPGSSLCKKLKTSAKAKVKKAAGDSCYPSPMRTL